MTEFTKRGVSIGAAGLWQLGVGIVLLALVGKEGAILVATGSWFLGVAAMYLDPPGGRR